jgi:hypothetical protein
MAGEVQVGFLVRLTSWTLRASVHRRVGFAGVVVDFRGHCIFDQQVCIGPRVIRSVRWAGEGCSWTLP